MKKIYTPLFLCLVFIITSATRCEDDHLTINTDCRLTAMKLYHKDNTGVYPETPKENKIKKEAYVLDIYFQTELIEEKSDFDDSDYIYQLKDGIVKITIFTEEAFNDQFPKGSDISSCFKDYPSNTTTSDDPIGYVTDITTKGGTIQYVKKENLIRKSLMTHPNPGIHQFRVLLTTASGATFEQISEPINLY